jgi:cohesin loading factor subunit SCC2
MRSSSISVSAEIERWADCLRYDFVFVHLNGPSNLSSGYRITNTTVTAVLHKWYSLVKEKRTTRMDFIRTVTKAFDVDSTKLSATEQDVDFIRFVIENFSAFEYKTQEEVLAVIRSVTNVLSVAGMQMMEVLSPSDLMKQLGVEGTATPIEVWSSNNMFV